MPTKRARNPGLQNPREDSLMKGEMKLTLVIYESKSLPPHIVSEKRARIIILGDGTKAGGLRSKDKFESKRKF